MVTCRRRLHRPRDEANEERDGDAHQADRRREDAELSDRYAGDHLDRAQFDQLHRQPRRSVDRPPEVILPLPGRHRRRPTVLLRHPHLLGPLLQPGPHLPFRHRRPGQVFSRLAHQLRSGHLLR